MGKSDNFPLVFDPRLKDPNRKPAPVDPEFQGDLDSLFKVVDAQMVDRRAPRPPDAPTSIEGGRRADDHPDDFWIGFGVEEFTPGAANGATAPAAATAAPAPPAFSAQEVADLVIAALRDQMKTEIREQVRAVVKACVDDALRDAPARKAPPAPPATQPRISSDTVFAIRWRRSARGTRPVLSLR